MVKVLVVTIAVGLTATACAGLSDVDLADAPTVVAAVRSEVTLARSTSAPATADVAAPPAGEQDTTTEPDDRASGGETADTVAPSTSTTTTSTTTTTTTTTTTAPPPPCAVTAAEGDTVAALAASQGLDDLALAQIVVENGLTSTEVAAGTPVDVCPGNGFDDVNGIARADATATGTGVELQQAQLNALFDGLGIAPLDIDGDAGPVTRQRLCAARLAFGLPTSTAAMERGSDEERVLLAATALPVPSTSATESDRWILIDRTCQIMFVGTSDTALQFVFPTSTGLAAFPTRPQDRTPAYRYNPAAHNGGWHNSTTYPAADDNPLNGNMYRPLYFDGGQAIHGANSVPRSPASHGCARLRPGDQDRLLDWLGLGQLSSPTADAGRIGVTVNVQGSWNGN